MERFMNFLSGLAIFFCLSAAVLGTIVLIYVFIDAFISKDNYSYATYDGTSGVADFCDTGRGEMYCTKDGRTFTVKEFSRK